jgi:hypothetical protein
MQSRLEQSNIKLNFDQRPRLVPLQGLGVRVKKLIWNSEYRIARHNLQNIPNRKTKELTN